MEKAGAFSNYRRSDQKSSGTESIDLDGGLIIISDWLLRKFRLSK
jgi:hypothetical protein